MLDAKRMMKGNAMNIARTVTLQLAFVDTEDNVGDPTVTAIVADEIATDLARDGYSISPTKTGQRGGVFYDLILQIGQNIQDHKDLLIALLGMATPILTYLLEKQKKQTAEGLTQQTPDQLIIVIGDARLPVRHEEDTKAETLLNRLLEIDPGLNAEDVPLGNIVIQLPVPPRPRRDI
jgi:hypothetical protein